MIPCPGNSKWAMVEGDVYSVQRARIVRGEVTGFQLAHKYKGVASNLPETQPLNAFVYNDQDRFEGDLIEFYEEVRAESTEELEPIEWQVIDMDCEPVELPKYVLVKFPDSLRQYPQTWHKYPCVIGVPDVFNLVYDRVAEVVDSSDRKYGRNDYRNIQILGVWENVPVNFLLHKRITS
ncbi:unnamed protein product, partial [marine sediment metagenome]